MRNSARWWSVRRLACTAFAGTLTFLALGVASGAQEKEDKKDGKEDKAAKPAVVAPAPMKEKEDKNKEDGGKARNVARLGYTRPGVPEDTLTPEGKIRQVALDPDFKDKLLGGTVYFMVLERTGDENDTWGTGLGNFNERFVEGKNYKNNFSPALDTQAKYIYLYQVVNDRGLEPPPGGIKLAAAQSINVVPIAGSALKISVDPRYITSWGHFKGAGFVTKVPDRDRKGIVRVAANNTPEQIRLAVSSNPSVLAEIPNKRYLSPAPALSLKKLSDTFGVGSATLNLKNSAAYADLAAKKAQGIALVAYEQNIIKSVDDAKEPQYVQLLYSGVGPQDDAVLGQEANTVFRADWRGKEIMDLGFHSVVYGFTSDLPPKDEPIRIEDKDAAQKGAGPVARNRRRILPDLGFVFQQDDEQFVQQGGGAAPGTGVAPAVGTAPAPAGAPGAASFGPSPIGSMGGGPAGFPTGAPMGGGFGGGGGGIGGFGGVPGTGSGGGFGSGAGAGNAAQQEKQQGAVNINISLKNQQQQSQQQQQQQQQQQNQTPPTGVVPEPGTIILGLLGLPGLYFLRRRLTRSVPAAA